MINKKIMDQIKEKCSGISLQRIYQLIDKTQEKYGIVDKETAAYVFAFNKKININKHLSPEDMSKVQSVLQSGPRIIENRQKHEKPRSTIIPIINFDKDFTIDHPILPKRIIDEAQKMARVYPAIYVFENSVRNIVQNVMQNAYGPDWWSRVSSKIRDKVNDRKVKEGKNKWHGSRGAHEIFYTDIDDLNDIITTFWKDFQEHFPSQTWINSKIDIIGTSRNIVAHNNPLGNDDIEALKINFQHWVKQVKDFETRTPKA